MCRVRVRVRVRVRYVGGSSSFFTEKDPCRGVVYCFMWSSLPFSCAAIPTLVTVLMFLLGQAWVSWDVRVWPYICALCMYVSNGVMHTVNTNDRYKTKCVTIALIILPFECQHATSMNPVRDNKWHQSLRTNNKDCSKGEGPIWNEDFYEKEDYNSRGSTRGLTTGVLRTMTSKMAAKRDQSEMEINGDQGAKTGE